MATPNRKQASVQQYRYLAQSLLLPLFILYLLVTTAIIVCGLTYNFNQKHAQIQQQARLLAHSATYSEAELVMAQVQDSMQQDPLIKDIRFYSFDQTIDYSDDDIERWRNALFNDSLSFNEGVYLNPSSKPLIAAETEQGADAVLLGYMTITLDLNSLREQWFRQNWLLLLSLLILFTLITLFILHRLTKALAPLFYSAIQAKYLLNNKKSNVLGTFVAPQKGLEQTDYVYRLITTLANRYYQLQNQVDTLMQTSTPNSSRGVALEDDYYQNMVAHEFNNDLATINDGLARLDAQYISEEQADAINIIRQGSQDLEHALHQIIQLNHIDKGQVAVNLTKLYPVQLIEQVLLPYNSVAIKLGLKLVPQINHNDQLVVGDALKIQKILTALLSHAFKHTYHGSISLSSQLERKRKELLWFITISDTSDGIHSEHLDDIFIPFFKLPTSRPDLNNMVTTGNQPNVTDISSAINLPESIGLGIAKRLVHLLGGELTVTSEVGQGSTFELMLPLLDQYDLENEALLDGIKILALEDVRLKKQLQDSPLQALTDFGATVDILFDKFSLIQQLSISTDSQLDDEAIETTYQTKHNLNAQMFDVVLLSDKFDVNTIIDVCQRIRSQEHQLQQRVLIVWYGEDNQKDLATLQAAGLDAVINHSDSMTQKAQQLKALLGSG